MYGPAVRCKWILPSWRGAVLHQCIRPLIGACCAPGHHGYQRACDLISGKASSGPFGSSVFACAGKTEPPSRFILSQTSAGSLRIAEVILLSLRVRAHVLRRHQTSIVAKRLKLATEMMRTDAGLHADQARRHVGKACGYLATRPLLMQHDRAALIVAHDVERVLTDINADYGDCGI